MWALPRPLLFNIFTNDQYSYILVSLKSALWRKKMDWSILLWWEILAFVIFTSTLNSWTARSVTRATWSCIIIETWLLKILILRLISFGDLRQKQAASMFQQKIRVHFQNCWILFIHLFKLKKFRDQVFKTFIL